jgi:hypothetical protein
MSKVEIIEQDVEALTPAELAAFRIWFLEFDAQVWDRQIEEDVRNGRLDKPAEEALAAQRTVREKVRSFEAFCCSKLLGLLSNASEISSRPC